MREVHSSPQGRPVNWAKRVTVTVIALPLAVANGFLTALAAFFTYWPGAGVGPSGPKETPEDRGEAAQ